MSSSAIDAPIGIFDSGVGGLTVARSVIDLLPAEQVRYVGDTAHGPYGPKKIADVRRHALAIGDELVESGVKALVIACNTASAACLADARERYPVPVVEVLRPAVRRAVAATRNGQLIAAADRGFARLFPGRAALEPIAGVQAGDRMSAGACDPAGRFVAGTLTHSREAKRSALYVLDGTRARVLVDGLTRSGGIGWSPSGTTMYVVDTVARVIWAFDYDVEGGRAGRGRRWVVCAESEGRPDGLAMDSAGGVWVAMRGSGRIHRYASSGDLETVLWTPTRRITGLAFGGRRLDEMYVTSACSGYDERALVEDPYAGALFRFRPGSAGGQPVPWNGT